MNAPAKKPLVRATYADLDKHELKPFSLCKTCHQKQ